MIANLPTGEAAIVLWSSHEQFPSLAEDTPEDECEPGWSILFKSAAQLIPAIETIMMEDGQVVDWVFYGMLPQDNEGVSPERAFRALGQEPIADFLSRLRVCKERDDNSGLN